jgi:2-polyprenyl-6-methoxyphenol hydroxylase-like FAD-dependent oxidoreductase
MKDNTMSSQHTPVLIVGAGPVGLALAGDLGWRGNSCILVEKTDGAIIAPKMDMVGIRTMEHCRRWGIADWVEHSPYPRNYPQDNVYVTSLTGYELAREIVPPKDQELRPAQSPQNRERCPQDMFDPILTRFVSQFPAIELRRRTELLHLAEHSKKVVATLRDLETGETYELSADFVVGTDGGSSTVRESLGIRMSGQPVLTYTTNIIFRCSDLPSLHDKGKAYRFIFIGPEGTWLTIVAINGADRWRMSIVGTAEKKSFGEDEVRALIRRAVGRDFDYEILSITPWVRRELVADSYGTSRILIAGDAAHLMSPTGGFGMNTGIGDAVDLGWKLDAVLRGWGGCDLLRSYEEERKPVAIRNVRESSTNLTRMLATRDNKPPPEIFVDGSAGDSARKEFGEWYAQLMRREWFTLGIHLGYRYDNSSIVWQDGTPVPPDEVATYVQTSRPGSRAPHVWLDDGCSTLDLFGKDFVLLRFGEDAPKCQVFVDAARERNVPLTVRTISDESARSIYERRLVLVRPDGHVAWRSDAVPSDAGAILDVARGERLASNSATSQHRRLGVDPAQALS